MSGASKAPSTRAEVLALAALLLLTVLVYHPVMDYGFCLLDDPTYVLQNAPVKAGLTLPTIAWAFRTFDGANWHPLTWLSHALDVQLFGLWAGGHHATSLVLHAIAAALVYFALRALTGAGWPSLAVAAIFAVHPMNVESVAWIAERKNVLSGVFYAATLLAYARYARGPSRARYALVTGLYVAGLLAKPMLVTIPFVLLLLDVWPLDRFRADTKRVLLEKIPWIAISAASSFVTFRAQAAGGALVTLQEHALAPRVCTATAGYFEYVLSLFWPNAMAIFIPQLHPACERLPVRTAAVALVLLSAGALGVARRYPFVVVGWAWFVGMLVPVCGLVQVGSQFIAERYVYHPMPGLALAFVFLLVRLTPARALRALGVLLAGVILFLAWRTHVEVRYWRNNESLFTRAIEVTGPNCTAETQLGVALRNRGDLTGAAEHWTRAVEQCADAGEAHRHLGALLANRGDFDAAIPHFAAAAVLMPEIAPDMHYNLALAFRYKGRREEALAELRRTLALDPHHAPALTLWRELALP